MHGNHIGRSDDPGVEKQRAESESLPWEFLAFLELGNSSTSPTSVSPSRKWVDNLLSQSGCWQD